MKKLIFEMKEFLHLKDWEACKLAQTKHDAFMQDLIDGAKVVYSFEGNAPSSWITEKNKFATHQALLVDIKEIEKNCEKHEPSAVAHVNAQYFIFGPCKFCGVEIEPSGWVAK